MKLLALFTLLLSPSLWAQCYAPIVAPKAKAQGARGWASSAKLWPQQSTVRVRFVGGSAKQQSHAWRRFGAIDRLVNLNFKNVTGTSAPSEIRVAFARGKGHWSYIGTDARGKDVTMNLELSAASIGGDFEREWDRVTLHEVCHAIGLGHEHQHPGYAIPWNRANVIADAMATQGWTEQDAVQQIIARAPRDGAVMAKPDPASIMMYPIPGRWVRDPRFATPGGATLSPADIAFLKRLYP